MTRVWSAFISWRLVSVSFLAWVGFLVGGTSVGAAASEYGLKWVQLSSDKRSFVVEVTGLTSKVLSRIRASGLSAAGWPKVLSVFVEQRDPMDELGIPPMVGTYRVERGVILFKPTYPLQPGVSYRAEFRTETLPFAAGAQGLTISSSFKVPLVQSAASTVVREVYPTSDVLPENLLKFYIHFSSPMSRGRLYEHIHLRNASGAEVVLPFLEIEEELWDPSDSRLTLFIDPGRIKRGVQPLEQVGPALETGKRYTLFLDRDFKDGMGNPLKEAFAKSFLVSLPDRDPPDPATWKIESPKRLSRDPLMLVFPEPMDHALGLRMIHVTNESGSSVAGEAELIDQERRWRFTPDGRWNRGRFFIQVQTAIEDLAGNNIGKPFDVDLFEGVQKRFVNSTVRLAFRIF